MAGTIEAAADQSWASANAAALLHVTAQQRKAPRPNPAVIDALRESAMQAILSPKKKGEYK